MKVYNWQSESHRTMRGSSYLGAVLLCLLFVLGVVVGVVFCDAIANGVTGLMTGLHKPLPADGANAGGETEEHVSGKGMDQLTRQLIERVKDSCSSLQALISLFAVIVVLIGIALGVGIWRTEKYAERLIDGEYKGLEEKVISLLDNSKRELNVAHEASILNLLETYRITWDTSSQVMKDMEESRLDLQGVKEEDKQELIKKHAEEREARQRMIYYQICLLTKIEDVVINAAQQLGAMGGRAASALPDLEKALNRWPAGNKARSEIQRAIDRVRAACKQKQDGETGPE